MMRWPWLKAPEKVEQVRQLEGQLAMKLLDTGRSRVRLQRLIEDINAISQQAVEDVHRDA